MISSYLLRFAQAHETFRKPEIEALAELNEIHLHWTTYSKDVRLLMSFYKIDILCSFAPSILTTRQSPFAVVSIKDGDPDLAARLIARSVLCLSVHELWGQGATYDELHADIRAGSSSSWPQYEQSSFRFELDTFRVSQSASSKQSIIESFSYLPFHGRIIMKRPDQVFTIFEDYLLNTAQPHAIFFGRWIADSGRKLIATYDLKKRGYISTTSMDAELSLLTANLAMAAPGKLAYDPFMGTGSFPVSCAAFGAVTFGSDLDGRSIRGKGARNVAANFSQYGRRSQYLGGCTADLTNTPITARQILDIIICDPPYGVREGLKVLGHVKERLQSEVFLRDGTPAHLQQGYIPPKKPYSFIRMLDDILDFSATRLVERGRLCMWMPVAGVPEIGFDKELGDGSNCEESTTSDGSTTITDDDKQEYAIPQHPALKLVSVCQQDFNKWSRRLLTYRRLGDAEIDTAALDEYYERRAAVRSPVDGKTRADDLNDFRKQYFQGFRPSDT